MKQSASLIVKDACAWPNLFRIDSESIGAVIFNKASHGLEEGSLELWKYNRKTTSWCYSSTPCPNLPGQNRMHSCCGVNADGHIHVLSTGFTVADGKLLQLESLWHSLSKDGGESWTLSTDVKVEGLDSPIVPHGSILFDDSGCLQATVYFSFGKNKKSYTWLIINDGNSWKMKSQIGDGDTNEAHLVCANNDLFVAVRTHKDHHSRLFCSTNKGDNWLDRGPLTLPMQHPGHLLAINDHALLLTYGIRNKGLMAIGGRMSLDLGITWLAPFVLYQFPNETTDCGYPSSVLLDHNTILTGFYSDSSPLYHGYQFSTLEWQLSDYLTPKQLGSISDGGLMEV